MQSVSLWSDYIKFVQEHDPAVHECSPDGILKARSLFERAITAAGLHVTEGSKIWEPYREFELAVLHTIDDGNSQVGLLFFFLLESALLKEGELLVCWNCMNSRPIFSLI